MKARTRATWLATTLLALVLLGVLGYLFLRSQDSGESEYIESLSMLRLIKQADAQWEVDVLRSRNGLDQTYDELTASAVEAGQLAQTFKTRLGNHRSRSGDDELLLQDGEGLVRAIARKASLIETFKSHNAVLRNSLAFLPTAQRDVDAAMLGHGPERPALRAAVEQVHELMLQTMVYASNPSSKPVESIEAAAGRLMESVHRMAPDAAAPMETFLLHVRTLLREQQAVNSTLAQIVAAPTSQQIDLAHNALSREVRDRAAQGAMYRALLLVFAAIIVGLLFIAAGQVVRGHALVNRANRELQSANEHLEQRVDERTRQLQDAQRDLVAAAHLAGRAEIASNVLHNVGNVLNSVNVSASLLSNQLRQSRAGGLSRAMALVNEHRDDLGAFLSTDPKGRLVPQYLSELAGALDTERGAMTREIEALVRSVEHMKEVIAAQQSAAAAPRFLQPATVTELLDEALRINGRNLEGLAVEIDPEIASIPPVVVDRNRVMQILVNLVSNASHAVAGLSDRSASIAVQAHLATGSGAVDGGGNTGATGRGGAEGEHGRRLEISVSDNGVGIEPDNLKRIFTHGFTTREDGHGFGLHSCILAAQEMRGSLTAMSDGLGRGARFVLRIPLDSGLAAGGAAGVAG